MHSSRAARMGLADCRHGGGSRRREPIRPCERRGLRVRHRESSEKVQLLARAVRELVYDVLPGTVEVVWKKQGSVGWGIGPKKFTEQFAYLMAYKNHVTLGFYRGGELPDPEGLLPTSGGKQVSGSLSMRSLKITSLDDVRRPALRDLIAVSAHTGI